MLFFFYLCNILPVILKTWTLWSRSEHDSFKNICTYKGYLSCTHIIYIWNRIFLHFIYYFLLQNKTPLQKTNVDLSKAYEASSLADTSHLSKEVSSLFEENSEFALVPELLSPQSQRDLEVPGHPLWFYHQVSISGHCICDHPAQWKHVVHPLGCFWWSPGSSAILFSFSYAISMKIPDYIISV